MKVVVKRVVIENEEFALIKDTCERGVYYGELGTRYHALRTEANIHS